MGCGTQQQKPGAGAPRNLLTLHFRTAGRRDGAHLTSPEPDPQGIQPAAALQEYVPAVAPYSAPRPNLENDKNLSSKHKE